MRKEQIGDCTLYLGDCLEVMPTLDSYDYVISDAPYGTQGLGSGYGRRQLHSKDGREGRTIKNDEDLSALKGMFEKLKLEQGFVCIFYAARRMRELISNTPSDKIIGSIVWNKKQMGLGYTIRYAHEDIAVYKFGKAKPIFPIESVITVHQLEKLHPHQKPIELMERLVSWNEGVVLDPFMGSGTTGVACAKMGRKFIGIELDPDYFDIACKRIENAYKQKDLFY